MPTLLHSDVSLVFTMFPLSFYTFSLICHHDFRWEERREERGGGREGGRRVSWVGVYTCTMYVCIEYKQVCIRYEHRACMYTCVVSCIQQLLLYVYIYMCIGYEPRVYMCVGYEPCVYMHVSTMLVPTISVYTMFLPNTHVHVYTMQHMYM